jgi:hypothetical protein
MASSSGKARTAPTASVPAAPERVRDPKRGARLRVPNRDQIEWGRIDLEAQLPEDHPARAIWAVIERLELSALYTPIEARDEVAGAPAIDPKLLLALWVYATSEGEGSADFRSKRAGVLDALITQVLALLMKQELLDLGRVAQDGTRVRASAGASSFRREQTLASLMQQARKHLQAVTREALDPDLTARRAAARKRGAEQRIARLEAAIAQIPDAAAVKQRSGAKDATARASTTDPDARVMKMGDGGFRPAYNVQFATTADAARVIVGVEVTNRGSDAGQSTPMIEQIEQRTGTRPAKMLLDDPGKSPTGDGGYAQHAAIDRATEQQVEVLAPVPKPRKGETRDSPSGDS